MAKLGAGKPLSGEYLILRKVRRTYYLPLKVSAVFLTSVLLSDPNLGFNKPLYAACTFSEYTLQRNKKSKRSRFVQELLVYEKPFICSTQILPS